MGAENGQKHDIVIFSLREGARTGGGKGQLRAAYVARSSSEDTALEVVAFSEVVARPSCEAPPH
eukprot:174953-Pyramimonas_sp.AAC.1